MRYKEQTYTFYIIKFPNNTCYIGQTKAHEWARWGQHIMDCRKGIHGNKHIQKLYDESSKYVTSPSGHLVRECGAKDWEFEVIHREITHHKKFVNEIEQRYIKKYIKEGKMGVLNVLKGTIININDLRVNDEKIKSFL